MKLRVSKQKVVTKATVTRRGQVKLNQAVLPANALRLTGVHVDTQHLTVLPAAGSPIRYYYGAGPEGTPTSAMVLSLLTATYTGSSVTITVNPGVDQYIYYVHPVSLADPTFQYGGFTGGFLNFGSLSVNTPEGAQNMRVWRSTNANLGSTTIDILH